MKKLGSTVASPPNIIIVSISSLKISSVLLIDFFHSSRFSFEYDLVLAIQNGQLKLHLLLKIGGEVPYENHFENQTMILF